MAKFYPDVIYNEDSPDGELLGYSVQRDNGRDYRRFRGSRMGSKRLL